MTSWAVVDLVSGATLAIATEVGVTVGPELAEALTEMRRHRTPIEPGKGLRVLTPPLGPPRRPELRAP